MTDEHISGDRAWAMLRDETQSLTSAEKGHVQACPQCLEFVETFVRLARILGFEVDFPDIGAQKRKRSA